MSKGKNKLSCREGCLSYNSNFLQTLVTDTLSPSTGRRYWRSLDDLAEEPGFRAFLLNEFPAGAAELQGFNRRHFLKIMAASFALAGFGLNGCRCPEQRILPYAKQPERIVPGLPVFYATSMPGAQGNIPLVIETHQSRPTKIEGNPRYAPYGGRTDVFAQASILDLYDPDRSTESRQGNRTLTQADVYDLLQSLHKQHAGDGANLGFLAEPSTSPTRARLVAELKKTFPQATWAEYAPAVSDAPEAATEGLFADQPTDQVLRPHYTLGKAKRILSLDADFISTEPDALRYARDYAAGRRAVDAKGEVEPENMNRLYQVESSYSITGGMADHRLRLASSHIPAFAALLAAEFFEQEGIHSEKVAQLRQKAKGLPEPHHGLSLAEWLHECVADLRAHKGESLIVAGSRQPVVVHQLVAYLNEIFQAPGNTLHYLRLPETPKANTITELAEKMGATGDDEQKTLILLGGNPAYDSPADMQTAFRKIRKSPNTTLIRLSYTLDETAAEADYHIASTHYLETWSDGRTADGTLVPVQPMIFPLFDGLSENELLARLTGTADSDPYALSFATFQELQPGASQKDFERFLHDGFLADSGFEKLAPKVNFAAVSETLDTFTFTPSKLSAKYLEVLIQPSSAVYDGRYNNNGWCQELPDPMTKVCWDNALCISPKLARELDIEALQNNLLQVSAKTTNTLDKGKPRVPIAKLTVNGTTIEGPVHIHPGLADYTVVVTMGYGREKTGHVGAGTGFDVFPLVDSQERFIRSGAKLEPTDRSQFLASTQNHWSLEGRAIIREADAENYAKHPKFVDYMGMESHSPPNYGIDKDKSLQEQVTHQYRGNSLYKTPTFGGKQQWGMSIDLNTCTACNACMIACQSENNIPIVGKDQVLRGREMHWIRIDRYYVNDSEDAKAVPDDPEVALQPMACQHCEMAPCESVCPVNATVHDEEGLNTMAYNRCVGTRYCSNNCPYKVRRYNFFDWNKRDIKEVYQGPLGKKGTLHRQDGLQQMQRNPDVTVRMRGVMEKCTYCVQRIQEAKINQKIKAGASDDVSVPDGAIQTACQQVCPTDAIVFGDVADADTEVSKLKDSPRDYSVLGYLNIRPRTTYLARIRNPNQKISPTKALYYHH